MQLFSALRQTTRLGFVIVTLLAMQLSACGGGDGGSAPPASEGNATIGAAGGTVQGPDGVSLTIPANAVVTATTLRIARDSTGAPPLVGMTLLSPIYAVTPHGTEFDVHAMLALPYDSSLVPAGTKTVVLRGEPDGTWHVQRNLGTQAGLAMAEVASLSWFAVGSCTPGDAGAFGFGIGDCPANHQLEINIYGAAGNDTLVTPLEAATDITVTVSWARPPGLNRTDGVLWHGPGITTGSEQFNDASGFFYKQVGNTRLDPATIAGARGPNGKVLHYKANAQYCWTGFIIGRGDNQTVCWNFDADLPVTVHDVSDPTGAPVITAQPQPITVVAGDPVAFNVTATAPDTLTYLWQVLPSGITLWFTSTMTGPSFDIANAHMTQDGSLYRVQVCNTAGPLHTCVYSDTVRLTVVASGVAPSFVTSPAGLSVQQGQTASITASATGTPPPRIRIYQGVPTNGAVVQTCAAPGSGSNNTCTYTSAALSASQSGTQFYAITDNTAGTVTSNTATITVTSSAMAPSITTQPAAATTSVGGSAGFNVSASGSAPLSYQWLFNGTPLSDRAAGASTSGIAGSGSANLSMTNAQASDAGNFSVAVSNGVSSVTSQGATLTVSALPTAGVWALAAGNEHTCAAKTDGTVACWGLNADGQLGDGSTINRSSPVVVSGLTGVVALAAGQYHTCALKSTGTVLCWGNNDYGALGDGTTVSRSIPAVVSGLSGVVAMAAGNFNTCAAKSDGSVVCWGYNVGADASVTPVALVSPTPQPGLTGVVAIAGGIYHFCAARSDGTVACWGHNDSGQLGNGIGVGQTLPTDVSGLTGVLSLAAGDEQTCASKLNGTVLCWGRNDWGQLGDGTLVERDSPTSSLVSGVLAMGLGGTHGCAIKADSTLACWGGNASGQLGTGITFNGGGLSINAVPGFNNVTTVAAGNSYTCAAKSDGTAWCWGKNYNNQLGDGTTVDRLSPTLVTF